MRVLEGYSKAQLAEDAVREATLGWDETAVPEVVFAFVSTVQDPKAVASALAARFPKSLVVGCTSSGEHITGRHLQGSVVLSALCDTGIRWATTVVRGLGSFEEKDASDAATALFSSLGTNIEDFDPSEYFCISLIDGLRMKEEGVIALIADAIQGVRLVGGSAGDDLAFKETQIIAGGEALTDGAVLLMGHGKNAFEIVKHQHFTKTTREIVITKVDTAARRVYEIDGVTAIDAYAAALGLERKDITDAVTFGNPVTFSCNGEIYVRSIARLEPDGSIVFLCGLEEGMVLEVGYHQDIVQSLREEFESRGRTARPFAFMLGCNCILRALEAEKRAATEDIASLWKGVAKASVGFDTYGEQLDGVHINQTLVAIGFRDAA